MKKLNELLIEMKQRGSEINYSDELINEASKIIKKDYPLEDILNSLAHELKRDTENILFSKNKYDIEYVSGVSSVIYLPSFNNKGNYKIKIIGGSKSRNIDLPIDENTLFDVASITKLYTLLLLFTLEKAGYINLNDKISDVNPDFTNLEDFTFNDLIRLHGEIITDRRVNDATSYEEAYSILKTAHLKSNTRLKNTYTDFGAIIMGDTISKIMSQKLGRSVSFKDIMNEYLLKPLGLNNTMFNPGINSTGNGNIDGLVHDPKSRLLGGAVGSAGLFVNSDDLALLAKHIFSVNYVNYGFLNKHYLNRLGEITFPNSESNNKGNLGIFVKHPLGFKKTYTPSEFSTGSFSHEGWTGSVATFDPNNLIHQNILVNAIYEDEDKAKIKNDKPLGFRNAMDEYQTQMTKNTMLMYVIKEYYERYLNVKEDIDIKMEVR